MPTCTEIGNLRLLVKASPNTMPNELTNHAEAVRFHQFTDTRGWVDALGLQ